MKDFSSQHRKIRQGHLVKSIQESEDILRLYKRHKLWLLKAKNHYSNFNYSSLISHEILDHNRKAAIDEKTFFHDEILTREKISQIINLNLKRPIESYLVLKNPMNSEILISDMEALGENFFKNSDVDFCKKKCRFKKYLHRLAKETVIMNQLSILKAEDPKKYTDMLTTGLLNYVIESRFTEDENTLENSFLGGFLHDIGFLYLDSKYWDRTAQNFSINDLKKMQFHSELGYHLLKPWFHEDILNAAINHHIGEDNSGYPRQMVILPNHLSKLTGFASSFVSCLRKHKLQKALKIQEIYSREQSHSGNALKPVFKREFFQVLQDLKIQFNQEGKNIDLSFNRKYSVMLHNFLIYIQNLGEELKKIDTLLLNYVSKSASHRLDLQDDVDDVFDHIKKLDIIINSCGKSPGLRKIMTDNLMASTILSDIEIIFMELHRNNKFLLGLFSYLNSNFKDMIFESTVFKKALNFSRNIKLNISDQLEKEVSVFNLLKAVSE